LTLRLKYFSTQTLCIQKEIVIESLIFTVVQEISNWSKNSIFIYPLILSLISALIFWITFSHIPNRNRRKKLRPVLELDVFQVYNSLFSLFDLIMRHSENSPSNYQNNIRGGLLTQTDIELGLQNKCLNRKLFI
jgi:hypothetical protein